MTVEPGKLRRLFLIFNHELTSKQEEDARTVLGVDRIVAASPHISDIWSSLPPAQEQIASCLAPVFKWLQDEAERRDFILVQGDPGAVFLVVNFCFAKSYIPVYSTTHRQAEEEQQDNGTVKKVQSIRHVRYRYYGV